MQLFEWWCIVGLLKDGFAGAASVESDLEKQLNNTNSVILLVFFEFSTWIFKITFHICKLYWTKPERKCKCDFFRIRLYLLAVCSGLVQYNMQILKVILKIQVENLKYNRIGTVF